MTPKLLAIDLHEVDFVLLCIRSLVPRLDNDIIGKYMQGQDLVLAGDEKLTINK